MAEYIGGCPIHQQPWKTIPAGVSKKSGKSYPAFETCPTYGCTQKPEKDDFADIKSPPLDMKEPIDVAIKRSGMETVADIVPQYKPRDFEAEARGKVRNSVAVATIGQVGLVELTEEMTDLMDQWVTWIMGDK